MQCLLVTAHPQSNSLCQHLAATVRAQLQAQGHPVVVEDLYQSCFEPALSEVERDSYYTSAFAACGVQARIDRLQAAEALVLCFPTWWFGFPAMLKGWFDRVWAPGHAYDHARNLGAIQPRLHRLQQVLVVTTLGSPWWVDRFVLRQPVKRILKLALLGTCAPQARFQMLSLYRSEQLTAIQVERFIHRIQHSLARWGRARQGETSPA